ncbi:unnamed protein product [Didymodactylos carnosus]|uniref:Uncharacterized protein n=1 Tax=Didymodactylos carnosus TaxID=1234261 RepID=A0A8S2RN29_9BILA|nr:unnamed protein product [Didymodactylos carnosus]CAF4171053.1 unnamed protein product [Didymodactylos carnosus]
MPKRVSKNVTITQVSLLSQEEEYNKKLKAIKTNEDLKQKYFRCWKWNMTPPAEHLLNTRDQNSIRLTTTILLFVYFVLFGASIYLSTATYYKGQQHEVDRILAECVRDFPAFLNDTTNCCECVSKHLFLKSIPKLLVNVHVKTREFEICQILFTVTGAINNGVIWYVWGGPRLLVGSAVLVTLAGVGTLYTTNEFYTTLIDAIILFFSFFIVCRAIDALAGVSKYILEKEIIEKRE